MAEPSTRPGEPSRDGHAGAELTAVLAGLDRATRTFTERLQVGSEAIERSRIEAARVIAEGSPPSRPRPAAAPTRTVPAPPPAFAGVAAPAGQDPIREAEREARLYLEASKQRADRLVKSMMGAIEREAAGVRRAAEESAGERRRQAEIDAGALVEEARRVSERIVTERQRQIGALSDGAMARAAALTAGMEDAELVRAQFEDFVRALSAAADRIAGGSRRHERHGDVVTAEAGAIAA